MQNSQVHPVSTAERDAIQPERISLKHKQPRGFYGPNNVIRNKSCRGYQGQRSSNVTRLPSFEKANSLYDMWATKVCHVGSTKAWSTLTPPTTWLQHENKKCIPPLPGLKYKKRSDTVKYYAGPMKWRNRREGEVDLLHLQLVRAALEASKYDKSYRAPKVSYHPILRKSCAATFWQKERAYIKWC